MRSDHYKRFYSSDLLDCNSEQRWFIAFSKLRPDFETSDRFSSLKDAKVGMRPFISIDGADLYVAILAKNHR